MKPDDLKFYYRKASSKQIPIYVIYRRKFLIANTMKGNDEQQNTKLSIAE